MLRDDDSTIYSTIKSRLGTKGIKVALSVLVFLPILIIFIQIYYSVTVIQDTIERSNHNMAIFEKNKYNMIMTMINENYKHAKIQTESIKMNIVNDLDKHYRNDLYSMRVDYDSRDLNTQFYKILSESIDHYYLNKDDSHNRVFVANRSHILMDNSSRFYGNSLHKWDEYIEQSSAQSILLQSLDSITLDNNDFVIWIDNDKRECINLDDNIKNKRISDYVKSYVESNNISALSDYSIAVVSFVFEHRDVFDIPDVEYGRFMNNDKIYIIEILNIGDMIETNSDVVRALSEYDLEEKNESQYAKHIVNSRTGVTITLGVLSILLFFGIWCLVEYQVHRCTKQND